MHLFSFKNYYYSGVEGRQAEFVAINSHTPKPLKHILNQVASNNSFPWQLPLTVALVQCQVRSCLQYTLLILTKDLQNDHTRRSQARSRVPLIRKGQFNHSASVAKSSRSWLSIYQALSVSLYFSVLMYSSVQLRVHVRIKHDSILLENWIQEPMFRQYTPLILTHSPLQLPRTAICMPVVIGYFFYLTALLGIQFCFCDYQLQTSVDSISN